MTCGPHQLLSWAAAHAADGWAGCAGRGRGGRAGRRRRARPGDGAATAPLLPPGGRRPGPGLARPCGWWADCSPTRSRPSGPASSETGPSPHRLRRQPWQSTATSRAAQISRMRASARRPSRATSAESETPSTESRLTAERCGIGSSPGSRTTSLGSPRAVVVHGATSARPSRGIAASRDKTTTGRRPISASSHHHNSPRAGSALTRRRLLLVETMRGHPARPARRAGARRRRRSWRPPRRRGGERATPRGPRLRGRRRRPPSALVERLRGGPRPRSCSVVCEPCHYHATPRPASVPGGVRGRGRGGAWPRGRLPSRCTARARSGRPRQPRTSSGSPR